MAETHEMSKNEIMTRYGLRPRGFLNRLASKMFGYSTVTFLGLDVAQDLMENGIYIRKVGPILGGMGIPQYAKHLVSDRAIKSPRYISSRHKGPTVG